MNDPKEIWMEVAMHFIANYRIHVIKKLLCMGNIQGEEIRLYPLKGGVSKSECFFFKVFIFSIIVDLQCCVNFSCSVVT